MEAVFCAISVRMESSALQEAEKIADYSECNVYSVATVAIQGHISENFAYGIGAYLRSRIQTNHTRLIA